MMQRDERANMPRGAKVEQLKEEFELKENNQFLALVKQEIETYGKYEECKEKNQTKY